MSRRRVSATVGSAVVVGGMALLVAAPAGAAAPPEPSYGTAVVDGDPGEWSAADRWGTVVSNDPPNRTVASVSLRYDCDSGTLFALLAAAPGEVLQTTDPAEAYVRLGNTGKIVSGLSGNDGVAPDFAWIGASGSTATGFEASAPVAPGDHPEGLRIHAKLPDDSADGYETTDLTPRQSSLTINCPVVIAMTSTTTTTTTTTTPPTTTSTTTSTSTTTTTAPATTSSTMSPSTATTSIPSSVVPTSQDVSVPPTDTSTPPIAEQTTTTGAAVLDQGVDSAPPVERAELARTGSDNGRLAASGAALVILGAALVQRSRHGVHD